MTGLARILGTLDGFLEQVAMSWQTEVEGSRIRANKQRLVPGPHREDLVLLMDIPARNIDNLTRSLFDSLTIDHGAVPASPESKNPSAASPQSGSTDRGRVAAHYSEHCRL